VNNVCGVDDGSGDDAGDPTAPTCGDEATFCEVDGDCCSGLTCVSNACDDGSGGTGGTAACGNLGDTCATDSDCCGVLYCDVNSLCDDGSLDGSQLHRPKSRAPHAGKR
jgi:hypothetical protein